MDKLSWVVVETGSKSTTFRHTQKALEQINAYMQKHRKNKSLSINEMLEAHETKSEHPETGDFLNLPPFLRCQDTDTETWLPIKECIERCRTCNMKKFCEAWTYAPLP